MEPSWRTALRESAQSVTSRASMRGARCGSEMAGVGLFIVHSALHSTPDASVGRTGKGSDDYRTKLVSLNFLKLRNTQNTRKGLYTSPIFAPFAYFVVTLFFGCGCAAPGIPCNPW